MSRGHDAPPARASPRVALLERRVQVQEDAVEIVVDAFVRLVRHVILCDPHDRCLSLGKIAVHPHAHAGQHHVAHRRAACRRGQPHGDAEDVRLDLVPQGTARAPADTVQRTHSKPRCGCCLHVVPQAERRALQDRAHHVGLGRGERQPEEDAPRVRVPDRRAFAEHVGQEDEPVCAGRAARRLWSSSWNGSLPACVASARSASDSWSRHQRSDPPAAVEPPTARYLPGTP